MNTEPSDPIGFSSRLHAWPYTIDAIMRLLPVRHGRSSVHEFLTDEF